MTKIVWLASYPRSGNTWLRFLIGNLVYGTIETSAQLAYNVPDIHRFINGRHLLGPERVFIKTHWAWQPAFPLREDTEAAIYLIRHPIDVMESALGYGLRGSGRFARDAAPDDLDRYAREFISQYIDYFGDHGWYRQGFGTWPENVASWIDGERPFRRHVVRYEALRADPQAALTAIAGAIGIAADPARIADAVAKSSFERLAEIEEQELASGAPGFFAGRQSSKSKEAGFRFIGRGTDEARMRVAITDGERARALERFGPAMAKYGYS